FGQHENESDGRPVGRETVAARGNRPRARRLRHVAGLAGRWRRLWAEAEGLFQESFETGPASCVAESTERTNQSRRRSDNRQIRGAGNQNEGVCRSCPETNRRDEGANHFRLVRRQHPQARAKRKAGQARDGGGCEPGAIARVPENFSDAESAREIGGEDSSAFAGGYGARRRERRTKLSTRRRA